MEEEEDCDVLWEGSPLHQHLTEQGILTPDQEDAEVQAAFANVDPKPERASVATATSSTAVTIPTRSERDTFGVTSMVWPKESNAFLEIEIAQKLLNSELLVQEDEDFVSNFILTDEALESHRKRLASEGGSSGFGGRSYLSEALLISGSLAAVAGTVLYLSERTRVAATVAAVLPTAMAAMSSIGAARYIKLI